MGAPFWNSFEDTFGADMTQRAVLKTLPAVTALGTKTQTVRNIVLLMSGHLIESRSSIRSLPAARQARLEIFQNQKRLRK